MIGARLFAVSFWLGLACVFCASAHAETRILTYSTGTGFFVTRDGYVITNHHVVDHCSTISVSGSVPLSSAVLVAQDKEFDLALLKTSALAMGEAKLSTTKQPLRVRDQVVVVGYPGQSWEIGQTKTRDAIILNTHGPRGEERWLEFSDALAKGNSGGPLLDRAGNVVGVVAAKARLITTDVSEKVVENFDLAISLPVLRRFLESNGIAYSQADSGIFESSDYITEQARRFVVNVRCRLE